MVRVRVTGPVKAELNLRMSAARLFGPAYSGLESQRLTLYVTF
jgi:hypothetical protein